MDREQVIDLYEETEEERRAAWDEFQHHVGLANKARERHDELYEKARETAKFGTGVLGLDPEEFGLTADDVAEDPLADGIRYRRLEEVAVQ
jgi:hypothetical protein